MSPTSLEMGLLRLLAEVPFLDRRELAVFSGGSRGVVYEGVQSLEQDTLVTSIPHAAELTTSTRRYCLTAEGVCYLAKLEQVSVEELLRSRPVSQQWQRALLERLDALASLYRLASAAAGVAQPIRLSLFRSGPLDAALLLPQGKTVGLVRQGPTADRTAFAKLLWRLAQGPLPGAVLILASDEARLRHARRLLSRSPVNALLALERDAAQAGADSPVWRAASGSAVLDLGYILKRMRPGGFLPKEEPPSKADLPGDLGTDTSRWLSVRLKPAEKRALDLLADWPWISQKHLAGLLGFSETRASRAVNPPVGLGLATRCPETGGHLALTDRGLAFLCRRDRSSVGVARRRWSVALRDEDEPFHWRNVSGGRSRQLLRNIEHTAAVHGFIAALSVQARTLGWEIAQLDPPHRAARHFLHGSARRSVHPDAFGVLRRGPLTWPFFLEWERRAVRPVTMAARLAPYLRYYSSRRPTDDHGAMPDVLVVFDDDIAATHFLMLAERETARAGVEVPLRVSHRQAIDALGPLGPAWLTPGDWEPACPLPTPYSAHTFTGDGSKS